MSDKKIAAVIAEAHAGQARTREEFLRTSKGIDAAGWVQRLREGDVPDAAIAPIMARARKAARLVATPVDKPLSLGCSKLGGVAHLPASSTWPRKGDRPLSFVAQVRISDLPADVRETLHLPPDGLLSFFYDNVEQPWGFDPVADRGGAVLVLTRDTANLVALPFPDTLDEKLGRFPELRVGVVEQLMLPSPYVPILEGAPLDGTALESFDQALRKFEGSDAIPCHHIGGFAQTVQDVMEEQVALNVNGVYTGRRVDPNTPNLEKFKATAKDVRLVLQIDSDDLMKAMWGDSGRLYVWMYDADLKAQAFDRAWCILQCG